MSIITELTDIAKESEELILANITEHCKSTAPLFPKLLELEVPYWKLTKSENDTFNDLGNMLVTACRTSNKFPEVDDEELLFLAVFSVKFILSMRRCDIFMKRNSGNLDMSNQANDIINSFNKKNDVGKILDMVYEHLNDHGSDYVIAIADGLKSLIDRDELTDAEKIELTVSGASLAILEEILTYDDSLLLETVTQDDIWNKIYVMYAIAVHTVYEVYFPFLKK